MPPTIFVVSACLAGVACRYDGTSSPCPQVIELVACGQAIPLCPEVLGGLATPRPPCEKLSDSIQDRHGNDCTDAFQQGARLALAVALQFGATAAILKTRSPSCGFGSIYDGTFSKTRIAGTGLWAALLQQAGMTLYSEEHLPPHV